MESKEKPAPAPDFEMTDSGGKQIRPHNPKVMKPISLNWKCHDVLINNSLPMKTFHFIKVTR
jgi:hypothetical protein